MLLCVFRNVVHCLLIYLDFKTHINITNLTFLVGIIRLTEPVLLKDLSISEGLLPFYIQKRLWDSVYVI